MTFTKGSAYMNISIFIYTQSEEYAIIKMREVTNKLGISDEYSYSIEPYWKFPDMYEAGVETKCLLNCESLQGIADIWEDFSDHVLTTDTINDNVIKWFICSRYLTQ